MSNARTGGTALAVEPGGIRSVEAAIREVVVGRPVIVTGCEPDEGGIVFAASQASTSLMAFAVRHSSGFVCVALPGERCDALALPPMSHRHGDTGAAFCVTVDASEGVSTGISAADRTRTVRLLADSRTERSDFTRPGHVVPLAVGTTGVLGHAGLAEAASDLTLLAGERGVGAFGHLVSPTDPTRMASDPELREFGASHGIEVLDVDALVAARREELEARAIAV